MYAVNPTEINEKIQCEAKEGNYHLIKFPALSWFYISKIPQQYLFKGDCLCHSLCLRSVRGSCSPVLLCHCSAAMKSSLDKRNRIVEDHKGKVKYVNNFPNQCSYLCLLPFAPNSLSVAVFHSQYCYFVEKFWVLTEIVFTSISLGFIIFLQKQKWLNRPVFELIIRHLIKKFCYSA